MPNLKMKMELKYREPGVNVYDEAISDRFSVVARPNGIIRVVAAGDGLAKDAWNIPRRDLEELRITVIKPTAPPPNRTEVRLDRLEASVVRMGDELESLSNSLRSILDMMVKPEDEGGSDEEATGEDKPKE